MKIALRFDRTKVGVVEDKRGLVAHKFELTLGVHQVPYGDTAFLEIVKPSFGGWKEARPTLEKLRQAMREHVRDEFEICIWPPGSDHFLTLSDYVELMEPDFIAADLRRRANTPSLQFERTEWEENDRPFYGSHA